MAVVKPIIIRMADSRRTPPDFDRKRHQYNDIVRGLLHRGQSGEVLRWKHRGIHSAGLDIGYVPTGPNGFLRLSGQFGPPQLIFHWPRGPVLRMCAALFSRIFLLGIGKTRKATIIRTYFSLYIGLMYKSV